jgi:hypothetical protein
MAGKYAEGTTVDAASSQAQILTTLRKYGAEAMAFGEEGRCAYVMFRFANRNVQFTLYLPTSWQADEFRWDGRGRMRPDTARKSAYEGEIRRLWRCLHLAIKAKLEVVESGIATFEEEFLAHIVLPGGKTVGSQVVPMLDNPSMPSTLLAIEAGA